MKVNVSNCNIFVANNRAAASSSCAVQRPPRRSASAAAFIACPSVRPPAPDRVPVSCRRAGEGAAWWQRDSGDWREARSPARPHACLPLPPPPTHTWVAVHESRSYVRSDHCLRPSPTALVAYRKLSVRLIGGDNDCGCNIGRWKRPLRL